MTPPLPARPERPSGSNAGTLIALVLVLFCVAGLFTLVMFINPFIMGVLLVLGGFTILISMQYFLFGRWFEKMQFNQTQSERAGATAADGLVIGPGTWLVFILASAAFLLIVFFINRVQLTTWVLKMIDGSFAAN